MKRILLATAAALCIFTASAQNGLTQVENYIQVTGRAEKEITPNQYFLAITINEQNSKGKITVEQQQREMTAALKALGVNVEKQLTIADMSSSFFKKNNNLTTAQYQLELSSAEQVTKVYETLDKYGISDISISRVSHTDMAQYKKQVRIEAIQNAKQIAGELAEAVGQKAGLCFYIYDSNNDNEPIFYDNGMFMRTKAVTMNDSAEGAEAPLQFKSIKLRYSVQAKFLILGSFTSGIGVIK